MLMKCPKCGFVQPDDQFCATCGVDVKAYQSRPTPVGQKIFSHPAFWLGLFSLTALLTFGYLRQERARELEMRAEFLKKGPQFVSTPSERVRPSAGESAPLDQAQNTTSPQVTGNPPVNRQLPATESNTRGSEPGTQAAPAQSARDTQAPTTTTSPTNTTLGSAATQNQQARNIVLNVTYYEVEDIAITQALEMASLRSNMAVEFGDYRAGPLYTEPTVQSWSRLKSQRFVLTPSKRDHRWIEGSSEPELGFMLQITVSQIGLPLQAELDLIKLLPEEGETMVQPTSYPNTLMEIRPNQSKWFVSLRLPRNISKTALDFLKDPIFNIFASDSFLKMKSEFTLVLDFGTN